MTRTGKTTKIKSKIKKYYRHSLPTPIISVLFSCYIFYIGDLFQTDMDTARYLLSALVQSEAAILAIVVTLSLVAVQLTASSYSPRVIDIFRHSLGLWVLTLAYIFTMLYTLCVLKTIKTVPRNALILNALRCSFKSSNKIFGSKFSILAHKDR